MEITGTQAIKASRRQVWDALNDPDILKRCLPGCESIEKSSPEKFKAVMAMAIGPLRARFHGTLHMTDVSEPERCTMVFEGQGGAIGFGKGSSLVELAETAEGTTISYTASAQVGGKLAQVGSRLIDNVARKMADDFFLAFKRQIAEPTPSGQTAPEAATPDAPLTVAPGGEKTGPTDQNMRTTASTSTAPGTFPATEPSVHTVPPSTDRVAHNAVMVPGWWLLVATGVGSALTATGALLFR